MYVPLFGTLGAINPPRTYHPCQRIFLPHLHRGLFAFALVFSRQVAAISAATAEVRALSPAPKTLLANRNPGDHGKSPPKYLGTHGVGAGEDPTSTVSMELASRPREGEGLPPGPVVTLEAARLAAVRMRETFGLSIFGFDLFVDRSSGETMVIDVNYFPSFKDLADFPQVGGSIVRGL